MYQQRNISNARKGVCKGYGKFKRDCAKGTGRPLDLTSQLVMAISAEISANGIADISADNEQNSSIPAEISANLTYFSSKNSENI